MQRCCATLSRRWGRCSMWAAVAAASSRPSSIQEPRSTGVDILDQPCPTNYARYVQGDIRDLASLFPANSFECVVALDVIEHLPKEAGYTFLSDLERIARERVVLFTPNGFLAQAPYDDNPFQEHLSGWNVEELTAHGFEILGVNGWRPLRGERAQYQASSCLGSGPASLRCLSHWC